MATEAGLVITAEGVVRDAEGNIIEHDTEEN